MVGDREVGEPQREELVALLGVARQGDDPHTLLAGQHPKRVQVEVVSMAVVDGARGGRARDHHGAPIRPLRADPREDAIVRLERVEDDLFLQPWVEPDLGARRALPRDRRDRERLGQQYPVGEPEGEMVRRLVLVVHRRDRRDTQPAGRGDLRIRVVG